jgi:hypothetical protein
MKMAPQPPPAREGGGLLVRSSPLQGFAIRARYSRSQIIVTINLGYLGQTDKIDKEYQLSSGRSVKLSGFFD